MNDDEPVTQRQIGDLESLFDTKLHGFAQLFEEKLRASEWRTTAKIVAATMIGGAASKMLGPELAAAFGVTGVAVWFGIKAVLIYLHH